MWMFSISRTNYIRLSPPVLAELECGEG